MCADVLQAQRVTGAILVLNAGSSSLKFEVFEIDGDGLARALAGIVEELGGRPRFSATDAGGAAAGSRTWDAAIGHAEALDFLLGWLGEHGGGRTLVAVGHRVVHGGAELDRKSTRL